MERWMGLTTKSSLSAIVLLAFVAQNISSQLFITAVPSCRYLLNVNYTFGIGALFPLRATRELSSPQVFRAILVLGTLMYLLLAIWGLASRIGLFRLRNWARNSTIVFSALFILMGGFGGLGALVLLISLP